MMRGHTRLPYLIAPMLLIAGCAASDDAAAADNQTQLQPDTAALAAADDGQWISLTGKVVSTSPEEFVLDYGAGNVTVEMDDWDRFKEGRILKPGDQVTVSGLADEDLLMKKRIEARAVYVRNLNSVFFASSDDEETLRARAAMTSSMPDYADVTGLVTAIEGREFTVGRGPAAIRVDTSLLGANPLDNMGVQRVDIGDRVFVWGNIDLDPAESAEMKARGLITVVPLASAKPTTSANRSASATNQAANTSASSS